MGGVSVDYLTAAKLGDVARAALHTPEISDGLPVVSVEALIYMKLITHRMRDRADVTELLKRGADAGRVRKWLGRSAPDLLDRFDALASQAAREE